MNPKKQLKISAYSFHVQVILGTLEQRYKARGGYQLLFPYTHSSGTNSVRTQLQFRSKFLWTPLLKTLFFILFIIANFAIRISADETKKITVCFYDAGCFSFESEKKDKDAMANMLASISPDILLLAGIKEKSILEIFKQSLNSANFAEIVEAEDKERHLAIVSKIKPVKFIPITDQKYSINNTELPVKRGFMHCIFNIDDYVLHIVAAHLQEREKVEGFNQTDMRRYEARLLRYYVNSIIKADSKSNILVVGNMNDTCGMATIKEIYSRKFDSPKRLYDIRPTDNMRTSWTFWNSSSDEYERIDYFMATYALLPEIIREKTFINQDFRWKQLSKHRPIIVGIKCRDENLWTKEKVEKFYPNAIYQVGVTEHFEEDKPVGEKPKRNPPTIKQ